MYRQGRDKTNDQYLNYQFRWYYSDFIDIHIIFELLEVMNDIKYILNLTFKKAVRFLNNHQARTEWKNAITWTDHERSKIKSDISKPGQKLVNLEFLEDHLSGVSDPLSNALGSFAGVL